MTTTTQSTSTMSLDRSSERTHKTTQQQGGEAEAHFARKEAGAWKQGIGTVYYFADRPSFLANWRNVWQRQIWQRQKGQCVYCVGAGSFLQLWGNPATTVQTPDVKIAELCDALTSVKLGDDGDFAPSEYAYWTAARILAEAYGLLRVTFSDYFHIPTPVILADDEGSLRVRWVNAQRELRANFGATPQHRSYLYFEDDTTYGLDSLSEEALAGRLRRLIEG